MIGFRLDPVDTLFFRDGTPFTADSAPQDDVNSLFPPHPATVAGALRAALARANGWNGHGRWPEAVGGVLGDGSDDPGMLSIDGPFLLRDERVLFRAPRHLLGATGAAGWLPRVLLRPGPAVVCDLGGAVRLPEAPPSGEETPALDTGDRQWLTAAGMETVLRGACPSATEVVTRDALWSEEARIGLERERQTRTAKEGMLYSTRHVRLKHGVSLGARVAGVPESWTLPFDRLVSLGGESRLVECRPWRVDPALAVPRSPIITTRRVAVIALSPLDLNAAVATGGQPLLVPGGGDVRIVSACLDRPLRIGGWNSLVRRPLPLRSVLAPGSVLFCEVAEPNRFLEAMTGRSGLPSLGERQAFGFGTVALGTWPNESEAT